MSEPYVEYRSVSKSYDGKHLALANLDCAIRKGEFLTFLGPSGSGKTTALMILAGFEAPTAGDVLLNGRTLARTPPYRRNMGVVFQNYALFPHMTVAENIAFPLAVRGVSASERRERVGRALDLVALSDVGERRPAELSGGQQQRVAFARALIFDPDLVLMDEPLGALDKSLREQLQLEIKRIQARLGLTVVYVTHDQVEALTMSDRIAVFDRGRIRQLASPRELYEEPQSAFVASFVGHNNSLSGVLLTASSGNCTARTSGGSVVHGRLIGAGAPGDSVTLAIRPECIGLDARGDEANAFEGRVREIIYHGDHIRVRVALPGGESLFVKADRLPRAYLQPDAALTIAWSPEDCRAFTSAEPQSIAA